MIRRIRNFLAVAVLAAAPIATLAMPVAVHALPAAYCNWTGNGADGLFSNKLNWAAVGAGTPCSGTASDTTTNSVPGTGDNIVIDNTTADLTQQPTLNSALTLAGITFAGTGTTAISLGGTGAITLTGDITDTSNKSNTVTNNISQSGTTTVTVTVPNILTLTGAVSGTGSIVKAGTGNLTLSNLTATGALTVNAGTLQVSAPNSADATVSGVTVASGATFGYDAFTSLGTTTYTFSTPITTAGTLDFEGGAVGSTNTLNLTGTITLTDDSELLVSDGTTAHIKGGLHGPGFVLSATTGSVLNESTDNTTDTPSGELVASDDAEGADDGATAPDTGSAFVAAHPLTTLAVTIAAAGTLLAIARMTRKSASRR